MHLLKLVVGVHLVLATSVLVVDGLRTPEDNGARRSFWEGLSSGISSFLGLRSWPFRRAENEDNAQERMHGGVAVTSPGEKTNYVARLVICPNGKARGAKNKYCGTLCSATLLNTFWLLTAASCATNTGTTQQRSNMFGIVGDVSGSKYFDSEDAFEIDSLIVYPQYSTEWWWRGDLAMARMKDSTIPLGQYANIISYKVPTVAPTIGSTVVVAGFGNTINQGFDTANKFTIYKEQQSVQLRTSPMTLSAVSGCITDHELDNQINNDTAMCLSRADAGNGLCPGDGGGPVVTPFSVRGDARLVAVVSTFFDCDTDKGALATRITAEVRTWIDAIITT